MKHFIYLLDKINPLRFLHSENEGDSIALSLHSLVLSLMLILYIIMGPLMKNYKIKIFRASGVIMVTGIIIKFLSIILYPDSTFYKEFQINDKFFFTFILPLIIFSSSYNSKFESFIKYLRHILLFSISGTIISFIFISLITIYLNNKGFFTTTIPDEKGDGFIYNKINFSLLEILQFSAAICASDLVTSLSMLMEDDEPKLNAISLGDSIFNNAISICIFNSIYDMGKKAKTLSFGLSIKILLFALLVFVVSLCIGGLVGVLHSMFIRYLKKYKLNRVQEISIILLFAFISYILCDLFNLSPMTSLLGCGLCMSHYSFYNLNYQTREESSLISLSLSLLAESLIFSNLGMSIVYYTYNSFSMNFILTEVVLIVVFRIFTIFGQIYILELCGVKQEIFKIKTIHKSILSNNGSIRGIVSFGLSKMIFTNNTENKNLLLGTTIYIIFLTNLILTLISPLFKRREKDLYQKEILELTSGDDKVMKGDIFTFLHPNTVLEQKAPKKDKIKDFNSFNYQIQKFDNEKILPKIILRWPECKEDHNSISKLIKDELSLWAVDKEKNKTYKDNDTIQYDLPGINNYKEKMTEQNQDSKIQKNIEMKEINDN